jgi:hypothetical protein
MKKDLDRRTERRKSDEDIAERISGGVRLDRSSSWRERGAAHDQPSSPQKSHHHKSRRSDR